MNRGIHSEWEVKRIRFVASFNPKASISLQPNASVSFLPMDAIGDDGSLQMERTRVVAEVSQGYTYFEDGDVSIAKITPCFENGKGAVMQSLVGGVGFGTTELIILRPEEGVNPRFLYYLTQSGHFRRPAEAAMLGAGGQKRVPDLFVKDFSTLWPGPSLQDAIAFYLDQEIARIGELVETKRCLLGCLEELKASALDDLMCGIGVDNEVRVKTGELFHGVVPLGWSVKRLKFLLDFIEQGWSPQAETRPAEDGEWGVLKAGACNGGIFDAGEQKALPAGVEPDASLEIQVGDILMSRGSGSVDLVGSVALVKSVRSKLILCDLLYRLKVADETEVNKEWLVLALNSRPLRRQIRLSLRGAEGLTRKITSTDIKELTVAVPPLKIQDQIVSMYEEVQGRVAQLVNHVVAEIDLLVELRSSTITDAVLGRIDFRSYQKN